MAGLPWLLLTLLLTVPLGAPLPSPGLDPSWRLALNTFGDLHFGDDIVFTYGPWGFLDEPMITGRATYALALVVRTLALVALWLVSVRGLTRHWPLKAAAPVASVFVVLVAPSAMSTLVVAAVAQLVLLGAVRSAPVGRPCLPWAAVAGLAALAAVLLQVKFPNGLVVGALTAVALVANLGAGARRAQLLGWASAAGSFVAVGALAWLLRGQALSDVPAWVRGSIDATSGYAEAMAFEYPEPDVLAYAVAGVVALVALAATVPHLRGLPVAQRVAAVLVPVVSVEFAFKSAFTRHDDFHEAVFFVTVGALLLMLAGNSRPGSWLALAGAAAAVAMSLTTLSPLGPGEVRQRWTDDVEVLVSSQHHADEVAASREALAAAQQVPAGMLDQLDGHPVTIDPYESSTAWTYGLDWQPVPVFQLYAAYTPALDRLNATALADAPADQRVLRHEGAFADNRNPLWDSPLYHRALACRYRTVLAEASWSLLAKARSRCGTPESLGVEHLDADQRVEVPPGDGSDMVLARFTPDPAGLLTRAGRLLTKPWTPMTVTAGESTYRLSRASSPSGLLVRFPTLEAGAYPPVDIRSLVFSEPGTLELVRVPIS
ncbi:hypothetical protein C7S10_01110 [Nocardioides currus]|uniref:Uncharacterized protein n=1 Tax=Nocardioides currus TaxID=2133958 RepID=A0A2R7Z2J7_9ACTN|nr:hypothetical protein C7S10_01110 [Nocardioides currus]